MVAKVEDWKKVVVDKLNVYLLTVSLPTFCA